MKRDNVRLIMKKILKTFSVLLLFGVMILSVHKSITEYVQNEERRTDIKHFKNIIIGKYTYDSIIGTGDYIRKQEENGIDVYILDSSAAMFNIPLDKYYKDYDMFNLGNFGTKGEDGIIEDIKQKENVQLFVQKDEYQYTWQNPDKVTKYVAENYENIGYVGIFNVYIRKELE